MYISLHIGGVSACKFKCSIVPEAQTVEYKVVCMSAVTIIVNYVKILDELPQVGLKSLFNFCCIRVCKYDYDNAALDVIGDAIISTFILI